MFGTIDSSCCFDTKKRDLMMYWRLLQENGFDIAKCHLEMIEAAKAQVLI